MSLGDLVHCFATIFMMKEWKFCNQGHILRWCDVIKYTSQTFIPLIIHVKYENST